MDKTFFENLIDQINKKPGISEVKFSEYGGGLNSIISIKTELTKTYIMIDFCPGEMWFKIESDFPEISEITLKILRIVMSCLWNSGYYTLGRIPILSSDKGVYEILSISEDWGKIITNFDDIFNYLKDRFSGTSVVVDKKKGDRIIIIGLEGSVVLKKVGQINKVVVEKGKEIAMRIPFINTARLLCYDTFEIYDNN